MDASAMSIRSKAIATITAPNTMKVMVTCSSDMQMLRAYCTGLRKTPSSGSVNVTEKAAHTSSLLLSRVR